MAGGVGGPGGSSAGVVKHEVTISLHLRIHRSLVRRQARSDGRPMRNRCLRPPTVKDKVSVTLHNKCVSSVCRLQCLVQLKLLARPKSIHPKAPTCSACIRILAASDHREADN